jgi:hypothetical protein
MKERRAKTEIERQRRTQKKKEEKEEKKKRFAGLRVLETSFIFQFQGKHAKSTRVLKTRLAQS